MIKQSLGTILRFKFAFASFLGVLNENCSGCLSEEFSVRLQRKYALSKASSSASNSSNSSSVNVRPVCTYLGTVPVGTVSVKTEP